MRATVDLAKLVGVIGDIVVGPRAHDHFVRLDKHAASLHVDDARLDAEEDEASADLAPAGHLFRRRYD